MGIIIYKSLFHPLDNVIHTTIYITYTNYKLPMITMYG